MREEKPNVQERAKTKESPRKKEREEMKLFKISQNVNNEYDTYDSAVVAAKSESDAASIVPDSYSDSWCDPEDVKVEYIGEARPGIEAGVIVASFNAG
jgi:hypothetical protein